MFRPIRYHIRLSCVLPLPHFVLYGLHYLVARTPLPGSMSKAPKHQAVKRNPDPMIVEHENFCFVHENSNDDEKLEEALTH